MVHDSVSADAGYEEMDIIEQADACAQSVYEMSKVQGCGGPKRAAIACMLAFMKNQQELTLMRPKVLSKEVQRDVTDKLEARLAREFALLCVCEYGLTPTPSRLLNAKC